MTDHAKAVREAKLALEDALSWNRCPHMTDEPHGSCGDCQDVLIGSLESAVRAEAFAQGVEQEMIKAVIAFNELEEKVRADERRKWHVAGCRCWTSPHDKPECCASFIDPRCAEKNG